MKRLVSIVILILAAIALLVVAVIVSGAQPIEALSSLLKGSLGSPRAISDTLRETSPLLMAGVAVYLALRAGLFNIGVEGQFTVGACACAVVALTIPGWPGILLGSAAGVAAGALWALPAGWIRAYRGGHEVITTIMLNNVAALLTTALVAGPIKDPTQEGTTTANLAEATHMPNVLATGDWTINASFFMGLLAMIGLGFWLRRTVAGFELRAVGANPVAATLAGIDSKRVIVKAMAASGAIGGLAGAMQVLAYQHRFYAGLSSGYGFDSLGVALLAGPLAIGLLPGAFLFGMLNKGGAALQILGVPKGITTIVLGILVVIAAAIRYRRVKAVES